MIKIANGDLELSVRFKEIGGSILVSSTKELTNTIALQTTDSVAQDADALDYDIIDTEYPERFSTHAIIKGYFSDIKAMVIRDHKEKKILLIPDLEWLDFNNNKIINEINITTLATFSGNCKRDKYDSDSDSIVLAIGSNSIPHFYGLHSIDGIQLDKILYNPISAIGTVADLVGDDAKLTCYKMVPSIPGSFSFERVIENGTSNLYVPFKGM